MGVGARYSLQQPSVDDQGQATGPVFVFKGHHRVAGPFDGVPTALHWLKDHLRERALKAQVAATQAKLARSRAELHARSAHSHNTRAADL